MIDLHGLLPCLRREVRRGAHLSLGGAVLALVAVAATTQLTGRAALVPGGIALLGAVFVWFGPLAHLGADRVQGYLEFDRTLPIALRVMATGRLMGASIKILPLFPAVVALLLGFRQSTGLGAVALLVVPLMVQVVATVMLWWLMAFNARWSFRRLWWLPTTVGFLPQFAIMLLPDSLQDIVEQWANLAIESLTATAMAPQGATLLLVFGATMIVACFSGATMLFASGLARYQFDPTQLGASTARTSRVELTAVGQGPLLAVARLRLRLATEQFRRELLVLVALFLVAAFGPTGMRDFARQYIPVLAALLPAGIALQLFAGRTTGALEGMQQLPHPARVIGLGHLLAITVMALPGAVALQVLHAMSGEAPTLLSVMSNWAWFVAIAWGWAAAGLWFRRRYLFGMLTLLMFGMVATMFFGEDELLGSIVAAVDRYRAVRTAVGPVLPFAVTLVTVLIGMPLFARGLSRYAPQSS